MIRVCTFDDQFHNDDRERFAAFLHARGQAFQSRSIPLNGEPIPPAVEGGQPIPRTETVFEIPMVTGTPQPDEAAPGGMETQEQADLRATGEVANAIRDAWRLAQQA